MSLVPERNKKELFMKSTSKVKTSGKRCNCKRSGCLKLYCECFAAGSYCDHECHCLSCKNNLEHKKLRDMAVEATLMRNPDAFRPKVGASSDTVKHSRGCNCKKSGCLKKYCECFQAGVTCGENCKCISCKNTMLNPERGKAVTLSKQGKTTQTGKRKTRMTSKVSDKRQRGANYYSKNKSTPSSSPNNRNTDTGIGYNSNRRSSSSKLSTKWNRMPKTNKKGKPLKKVLDEYSLTELCNTLVQSAHAVSPIPQIAPTITPNAVPTDKAPRHSLSPNTINDLLCNEREIQDHTQTNTMHHLHEATSSQLNLEAQEQAVLQEFALWMRKLTNIAIARVMPGRD